MGKERSTFWSMTLKNLGRKDAPTKTAGVERIERDIGELRKW